MTLKAGPTQRANHAHTRRRHEERLAGRRAYGLPLLWLRSMPDYREALQARIRQEANERDLREGAATCMECGGVIRRDRFTLGCGHCWDRQRMGRR